MIKVRRVHNKYKRMRMDLGIQKRCIEIQARRLARLDARCSSLAFELKTKLNEMLQKTKRISELQGTIDSLKRQNRELQAELIAKDSIIKKQTILMEEAKTKEAKYIKAGNQYYCSNCEADFQHYELFNKYCPECGAHFTNSRKEQA